MKPLFIREIQIKVTMKYHHTLQIGKKNLKTKNQEQGAKGNLMRCQRSIKWNNPFVK